MYVPTVGALFRKPHLTLSQYENQKRPRRPLLSEGDGLASNAVQLTPMKYRYARAAMIRTDLM